MVRRSENVIAVEELLRLVLGVVLAIANGIAVVLGVLLLADALVRWFDRD